ncbi:MAPEG family protein [Porphyrobacter sp. GA68]|uniref:MAPEG family protein n=1 Tax=Porphyrobacter sp. GA68 TaxID=2883480 RepID=UPI001D18F435|nr:MAPEG family protein [Porphyrobacter sp. GA68]
MFMPVTLTSAAAAAFIAVWLMVRIVRLRMSGKVLHGDGGDPLLARRIRAQLNFVESAPFVLILVAALELAGRGGVWLTVMAGVFWLGRVVHALGMDRERENRLRMAGTIITLITLLVLAVAAVLVASGVLPPQAGTARITLI